MQKIVTAGVICCQEKILIAQRKHGKPQEYFWEFPGGKLEKGETLEQCLHREIWEEFHLDVNVDRFFMESAFDYETGSILLKVFWASCRNPDISWMDSHERIKWITPRELDEYEFAPADRPVAAALKTAF